MRANLMAAAGLAFAALGLGGCGGGNSGISTASVLDGAPSGATGEAAILKNDDPNARSVQVGWTSARAQRCGFVFDAAKLKANFLAAEAARGTGPGTSTNPEKAYDQAVTSISAKIKAEPDYCTRTKSAEIKTDLQRHLAGNYDANLPNQNKKVASGGILDGLISDEPTKPFDQKNFWEDQEAKRSGAKGAQRIE